ncbi:MAG: MaoC family dehydratase [Gammaproteobacteria bacterium]|nr:MaoC family dehydratase [Gammaproteobacteria bacterium]
MKKGDRALLTKAFSEQDVRLFAELSGDDNPVHLDKDYAQNTQFGQRIVHGMLVSSLITGLIGGKLPGHGCIYLGQTLSFKAPVYIDEEVQASVEVIHIREDKPIATLKTLCHKADGTVAIEGEAVVKFTQAQ